MIFSFIRRRPQPADARLIGEPVAALEGSRFFSWFAFAACAGETKSGAVLAFRPQGPAFHDHVRLKACLRNEIVDTLVLDLSAAMSDPGRFPFTLDCAKSLLSAVAPHGRIGRLAAALEAMMAERSIGRERPDGPAEKDRQVLAAVKVFAGLKDDAALDEAGLAVAVSSWFEGRQAARYQLRLAIGTHSGNRALGLMSPDR